MWATDAVFRVYERSYANSVQSDKWAVVGYSHVVG